MFSWTSRPNELIVGNTLPGNVGAPARISFADTDLLQHGLVQELIMQGYEIFRSGKSLGQESAMSKTSICKQYRRTMREYALKLMREIESDADGDHDENATKRSLILQLLDAEEVWNFVETVFFFAGGDVTDVSAAAEDSLTESARKTANKSARRRHGAKPADSVLIDDIGDRLVRYLNDSSFGERLARATDEWWAQAMERRQRMRQRGGLSLVNSSEDDEYVQEFRVSPSSGNESHDSTQTFWPLVIRLASVGNVHQAASMTTFLREDIQEMITSHLSTAGSDLTPNQDYLRFLEIRDEDLNIAEAALLDCPAQGTLARSDGRWRSWQEECFATAEALSSDISGGLLKGKVERKTPIEHLLLVLSGDPLSIMEFAGSWFEAFVSLVILSVLPSRLETSKGIYRKIGDEDFVYWEFEVIREAHALASESLSPDLSYSANVLSNSSVNPSKPAAFMRRYIDDNAPFLFESAIHAVCDGDAVGCVAQMARSLLYFHSAHLADLLSSFIAKNDLKISLSGLGIRDHVMLEYANSIHQDPGLWQISFDYHLEVKNESLPKRLALAFDRESLSDSDSDPKIEKLLARAEAYGLPEVCSSLCERLGASAYQGDQMLSALYWFARAQDTLFKHRVELGRQAVKARVQLARMVNVCVSNLIEQSELMGELTDASSLLQDAVDTVYAALAIPETQQGQEAGSTASLRQTSSGNLSFLVELSQAKYLLAQQDRLSLGKAIHHAANALRSGGLSARFALAVVFDAVCALDELYKDAESWIDEDPKASNLHSTQTTRGYRLKRHDIRVLLDALEESRFNMESQGNRAMTDSLKRRLAALQKVTDIAEAGTENQMGAESGPGYPSDAKTLDIMHHMRRVLMRAAAIALG